MTRTILHVDMDAFYVSVELRRRPELRGRPVVVGGTGSRGVVAAASYEARRYGVFSAMPSTRARRACPDLVFLPGHHELYASVSAEVHEILHSVTPSVEPLALDEAFLDVSGAVRLFGDGVSIGQRLRREVREQLHLDCSVGVAPNKFLAKLASKAAKPVARPDAVLPGPGVVEVRPGEELAFLHPLPVQALWGVGPATLQRLERFGVQTVGDLAALDESALVSCVGKSHGHHLHELSWARDDRPVDVGRDAKSIGHEETFPTDLHTDDELHRQVVRLADAVASRLRANGTGARTVTLKVRFAGFETITRSTTVAAPLDTAHAIVAASEPMLEVVDPGPGIRLVGVSCSNFGVVAEQLSMDALLATGGGAASEGEWQAAEETVDAIRSKFGTTAIGPASAMANGALRVVRRGSQQWGPDHD